MYQWVNPTTGRSQLSGKAPAWYRSDTSGPRVLVFEKNVLVDDTAVVVDEQQRLQLRNKAIQIIPGEKEKQLTAAQAVATLKEQIQAIVESPAMEQYLKTPPSPANQKSSQKPIDQDSVQNNRIADKAAGTAIQEENTAKNKPARETADDRVERLKALISAWDEDKTKEAKSLLETKAMSEKEK